MIRKSTLLIALLAGVLALPTASFAAKGEKKGKKGNRAALMAAKGYDANGNGMIDGDEVAAIQKAYEADKNGALKAFDTNADSKLDATEVGAIKAGGKKKKNK
jgi:hypothetical protein